MKKKRNNLNKKLASALAMLLLSASMLGTSTYAWSSMNTQVTATGMQVKAQAEGGIVISNESQGEWKASATASNSTLAELIPTSTKDGATWYHAVSDDAKDAKKNQTAVGAYTTLSPSVTGGIGSATVGSDSKAVYLVNKFYIKSSAEAMTLTNPACLYINDVTITKNEGATPSTDLDKALRVAIKVGSDNTKIFAPISGADASYKVANTDTVTPVAAGTKNTTTSIVDIPAYSGTPIEVTVWVYFEGEDTNCKSENLTATLNTLNVSIQFGTTTVPTT
jgi:hypothetical protein